MRIRLVKLGIVVVVQSGVLDDVAEMVAELRRGRVPGHLCDQSFRNVALEFGVLDASGIAHDMEHHLFRGLNIVSDGREMVS